MAEVFYDDDADLDLVQTRNVAVLGYGSQGSAQALSLRDSGADVRVGLPERSRSRVHAEADGLRVVSPYEACEESDLVVVLVPDPAQPSLYTEAVEPNLVDGDTLLFGHGFNVRYGRIKPPAGVDVVMVAPKGPGWLVRSEFGEGRGVPVLVAVEQDASGLAWELTLSYARAIGGTRAGAIKTTFGEETEAALFGEQAVSPGGVVALVHAGFETLVEAGYQPEVAYFECVTELKRNVDLMYEGVRAYHRSEAEYGGYTSGPYVVDASVRRRMSDVLATIQGGSWAEEYTADQDAGAPKLDELRHNAAAHPIERAGHEMRKLMAWVKPHDGSPADGPAAG